MHDTVNLGMSLAEFLELGAERLFELMNGERRPIVPAGYRHSKAVLFFFKRLSDFGRDVFPKTAYILPGTDVTSWALGSRKPSLICYVGNRIPQYEADHPELLDAPLGLIPDLVVEIVTPDDRFVDATRKIDTYLADGVRLIWQVDAYTRKVIVFSPDAEQPHYLKMGNVLDGGDILPDFRLPLAELFAAIG